MLETAQFNQWFKSLYTSGVLVKSSFRYLGILAIAGLALLVVVILFSLFG